MTQTKTAPMVGEDELRAAVETANIPILLMVLVQLTGDVTWLDEPYAPSRTIGMDDNDDGGLSAELQHEIRAAAADAIVTWSRDGKIALESPNEDLLVRMLGVSMGEPIPAESGPRIAASLRTALNPEDSRYVPIETPCAYQVLIVGAGFSGVAMAARLAEAEVPFLVLEKAEDVGGVWWSNRYPGAGVDTPSYLYSLSFAPHPWKHYYAGRTEVQEYIRTIVDDRDLSPHIRLGAEVEQATFDEENSRWVVRVRDAQNHVYEVQSDILVSGVGLFNPPVIPDLPGLSDFAGDVFHTAEWPGTVDISGKRVGVVGNGASAMQTVPSIAPETESVTVFQRSPQWIAPFPKFKKEIPEPIALLLREVPLYRAWFRERQGWIFGDRSYPAIHKDADWPHPERSLNRQNDSHRRFFERYLRDKLNGRDDLIAKCLPGFPPFAKRMLLDNGWFDSLRRKNVTLETSGIAEVLPTGVVTTAGKKYELDTLVFATGFGATRFISTFDVIGRNGVTLRDAWDDDDARAYLGLTVPGFPNFFMLYGPNINGGGGSVLGHLEAQIHYIIELLRKMTAAGIGAVDIKDEVYDEYNRTVSDKHENLIYTHPGVNTYYRNSRGRVVVQNAFNNAQYWQLTRNPRLSDFVTISGADDTNEAEAS
ncbi:flavin-containing monooxygenase [Nocardia jiangxiensis]|uniref:flavin-containing monooxygenase n=1 Tax=Nocardia jiangxiensis TaxID=282685 RepID=UPI0002F775BC|nr:NAD(P)/FAD-dependent oxidoreductase [Nocardia jiangxiensis]